MVHAIGNGIYLFGDEEFEANLKLRDVQEAGEDEIQLRYRV